MRILTLMLGATVMVSAAQAPVVQNGQVETRRGTIAAATSAATSSRDPVWLAWRVPLVAGDRELCGNWVNDRERIRGIVLDGPGSSTGRPTPAPVPSTVALESGTNLVVLVRMLDGRVERLRTVADDCPLDANGQAFRWLTDVTPADSIAFLESLVTERDFGSSPQPIRDSAISAIALHRAPLADTALDRLTSATVLTSIRTTAARWLANTRGDHGFDRVSALIRDERDARTRTTFVSALSRNSSPRTAAALLALARTDTESAVRMEAAMGYARLGAPGAVDTLLDLLAKESANDARVRIVASLDLVPGHAGVPALLNLAKPDADPNLRREAVRALSRSTDPRALTYLEGLLR